MVNDDSDEIEVVILCRVLILIDEVIDDVEQIEVVLLYDIIDYRRLER